MNALILMTRVPLPGQTKTRLMDIMTGEECARLHRCFLKDLMNSLKQLNPQTDVFITYTPADSLQLLRPFILPQCATFPQKGESLGERMAAGFNHVFAIGYEKVILIGSDIPHLNVKDIEKSFSILEQHDIVLGPTYDGGYYLIGMKEANEQIFNINKSWGGKSVFKSTIANGNEQGLSIGLAAKYLDIDTKEDLFSFYNEHKNVENPAARHTMEFIKEWKNGKGQTNIANS